MALKPTTKADISPISLGRGGKWNGPVKIYDALEHQYKIFALEHLRLNQGLAHLGGECFAPVNNYQTYHLNFVKSPSTTPASSIVLVKNNCVNTVSLGEGGQCRQLS